MSAGRPFHIVLDGRLLRKTTGGIGRYSAALITELGQQRSEHRFTVLLTPADELDWQDLRDRVPGLRAANWRGVTVPIPHYSLAEQTKLPGILSKLRPDLIHFLNFNHPLLVKQPFVVTIHDLTILHYPAGRSQTSLIRRLAFQAVLRHAARASRHIMTVSEASKRDLVHLLNIPAGHVTVTYEGVSDAYQPVNLPIRGRVQRELFDRLGIRRPYLLFISQWRPHKGMPILLDVYDQFRQRRGNRPSQPAVQLVIAGQPNRDSPNIPARIKSSPFARDIVCPGFVPEDLLPKLYQGAEAFLFPSQYEGFGLPLLEAMASGTPVLATETSSIPEVVGDAGVLLPPQDPTAWADAIEKLLTDASLWRKLRSAGLAQARHFSWLKMTDETLAVYQKVFESK